MPVRAGKEAVYDAANLFRDRCLREGRSLLWRESKAWTRPNILALWDAFIGKPDVSDRTFFEKWQEQLQGLPPDVQKVACDVLAFYYLFPARITKETKSANLSRVMQWTTDAASADLGAVTNAFGAGGIGHGGRSYQTNIPWQLGFFLKFADYAARDHIDLDSPSQCRSLADTVKGEIQTSAGARNVLLHLFFPTSFQRIASDSDRRKILEVLGGEVAQLPQDSDEALEAIRQALATKAGRSDLDFYDADVKIRWKPDTDEEEDDDDDEGLRYWIEKTLVSGRADREQGEYAMGAALWSPQKAENGGDIYRFMREVKPGDVVLHLTDNAGFTGVSRAQSAFEEFNGVPKTEWGDGPSYLVRLSNYRRLEPPLSRDVFFGAPYRQQLLELISQGERHLFYNRNGALNQGHYLTPASKGLLSVLDTAYRGIAGHGLLDGVKESTPVLSNWIFQANPDFFNLTAALQVLKEMTWLVRKHADRIVPGDRVFLWESGGQAGIVGLATVLTSPIESVQDEAEKPFNLDDGKFEGAQRRVRLRIDRALGNRLLKQDLLRDPVLSSLTILAAPQGTNFPVTGPQAEALLRMVNKRSISSGARLDLKAASDAFSEALRASGVTFGARHADIVRSFVASLATKRFVILTGLSGSGKTQLALRFGEWLGKSFPVPVRPDWTGAEALFGYPDALQPAPDGRSVWHVPDALAFMLRAHERFEEPHLLLLDEMNLAHVERYFADVLSGMESEYPCLPNLGPSADGRWRLKQDGSTHVALPRNLFVVGTVNVDETTYMFSPKVLDRANTFEFRVATGSLSADLRKPTPCAAGESDLVRGFLAIATDDEWHLTHPAPELAAFRAELLRVHSLLSEAGFEFGHRVFYEAVRFASMLAAAGDPDPMHALDYQVLQKVLPRIHGSRRRIESVLAALGQFCLNLAFDEGSARGDKAPQFDPLQSPVNSARLQLSFEKVRRMMSNLRANQFTSFTE